MAELDRILTEIILMDNAETQNRHRDTFFASIIQKESEICRLSAAHPETTDIMAKVVVFYLRFI